MVSTAYFGPGHSQAQLVSASGCCDHSVQKASDLIMDNDDGCGTGEEPQSELEILGQIVCCSCELKVCLLSLPFFDIPKLMPYALCCPFSPFKLRAGSKTSAACGDGGPCDCPESKDPLVQCTKCREKVLHSDTLSAGRGGYRICKPCYNSNRALSDYYRKRGRKDEWDKMPAERKRKLVVQNKGTGGRGKQRELELSEHVIASGFQKT